MTRRSVIPLIAPLLAGALLWHARATRRPAA